jgi:hypothetical protein
VRIQKGLKNITCLIPSLYFVSAERFAHFALMSLQAMSRMEWLLKGLSDGTKL